MPSVRSRRATNFFVAYQTRREDMQLSSSPQHTRPPSVDATRRLNFARRSSWRVFLCLLLAYFPDSAPRLPPCFSCALSATSTALGQHLAQAVDDVGRGRVLHIAHSGGALITYLAAQHHLTRRYQSQPVTGSRNPFEAAGCCSALTSFTFLRKFEATTTPDYIPNLGAAVQRPRYPLLQPFHSSSIVPEPSPLPIRPFYAFCWLLK